MQDAWITKLQRVQNPDLYTYYDSQKKRIARTPGAVEGTSGEVKQVRGWHGTGGFPAENIYNDRQVSRQRYHAFTCVASPAGRTCCSVRTAL